MTTQSETALPAPSFRAQVRSAVIWRSGTQIFSQLVAWASTFLVIRILSPSDYGLFAMTSVVLVLLSLLNLLLNSPNLGVELLLGLALAGHRLLQPTDLVAILFRLALRLAPGGLG